jgi:zinc transport system substrate-binding protein
MTTIIADKLVAIDPSKEKNYRGREARYIAELKKLDEEGKEAFKGKDIKMVTTHEAFDYFGKAFGIDIVGSIQKTPGLDPDSASNTELIALCKKKKVTIIAVEPQYDKSRGEALRKALADMNVTGIKVVTLDPIETADVGAGQKFNPDPGIYLTKMHENIKALKDAVK